MSDHGRELRDLESEAVALLQPHTQQLQSDLGRDLADRLQRAVIDDDVRRTRAGDAAGSVLNGLRTSLGVALDVVARAGASTAARHLGAAVPEIPERGSHIASGVITRCQRSLGVALRTMRPGQGESAEHYATRVAARVTAVLQGEVERALRTELYRAYNAAADAILRGRNELRRWDATEDWNLCERCAQLNGQEREAHEEFRLGHDAVEPPLHPNCRCRVVAVEDADASVASAPAEAGGRLSIDEAEDAMQEVLDRTGLHAYLQSRGVTSHPVEGITLTTGPLPEGKVIKGLYDPDTRTLSVATTPVRASGNYLRGDHDVSQGARSERESIQRITVHEAGHVALHHLREMARDRSWVGGQEAQRLIDRATQLRAAAVRTGSAISVYARTNGQEYFAECVTAYFYERDKMTRDERRLVEDALRHVGATP